MPTLKRPAVEIAYELSGSGTPVLLIHGVGVAGEAWRPQIDALSADHQLLSFDNRGIGRSQPCRGPISIEAMADDALALIDAAGWDSAHVVGHSLGGLVAQQLAIQHPTRVRSLALLCTFFRGAEATRLTPRVLWMGLRTRLGTRASRRRAFLRLLFPASFLRSGDPAELAAETGAILGRDLADQPAVVSRQLRAMASFDVTHHLHELAPIPTLVVSARHDPIALPEFGRRLAHRIPGAVYEEIADAAHGWPLQFPDRANTRLRSFFYAAESLAI